jgi:hypothetical protein
LRSNLRFIAEKPIRGEAVKTPKEKFVTNVAYIAINLKLAVAPTNYLKIYALASEWGALV